MLIWNDITASHKLLLFEAVFMLFGDFAIMK